MEEKKRRKHNGVSIKSAKKRSNSKPDKSLQKMKNLKSGIAKETNDESEDKSGENNEGVQSEDDKKIPQKQFEEWNVGQRTHHRRGGRVGLE